MFALLLFLAPQPPEVAPAPHAVDPFAKWEKDITAIEKRLKSLEKELCPPRRKDLVPVPPELPPDSMGLARIGKDEGLVSEQNKPMKIV